MDIAEISRKADSTAHAQTILVVAHAWHGDLFGGAFRLATELAKGLAATGRHVTYLCCNSCDLPERETIDGVDVRRYRVETFTLPVPRILKHIFGSQSLAKEIAAEFDIVAVSGHSPLQYFGVLRALSPTRRGRCSYVVHSPFAEELLANTADKTVGWKLRARAFVASIIDGWCLRRSDTVQCLSRFTAEMLERSFGSWLQTRWAHSPGWVDTNRFQPSPNRILLRTELPAEWHTDDPILLTIRRLEQRMGLDTLIEAAAEIASKRRFRLLIGGSGSEAPRLLRAIQERGLQDRIFMLGQIPEEQLASCYAAADAFVLPTRALECFGLIVLESFACETPVIASRVGAIPELLSQLGDRWMFESGDSKGLSRCLEHFLDGNRLPIGKLRSISLKYDIQRVLPRWIELCLGSKVFVPQADSLAYAK